MLWSKRQVDWPDIFTELNRTTDREQDRFSLTSTPYHANASGHNFPLTSESNITTRRPENIAHINKRKVDMVKPDKFDGSTSWVNFKSHFEIFAELNGWTLIEKGMYLAVALRGQAQSVLGNLPAEDKCNYRLLSKALEERFLPSNQTELYRAQLRERRQRASESLPELGQTWPIQQRL